MWEKFKNNNVMQVLLEIYVLLILIVLAILFIKTKTRSYYQHQNQLLLSKKINKTSEELIYKGEVDNNYFMFNNLLWRIVRVNKNGTIVLVLNDSINMLPWKYENDFDIINYLNNDFLNELDKTKLVKNNLCADENNDLNNIKCNNKINKYVSLLDASSFVNSIDNDTSYISKENDLIWLLNGNNDSNHFHTNGSKISYSDNHNYYSVKPVITLKNDIVYEQGNGRIEDPYTIKSNKISLGSKVIIDTDEYTVISTKPNIRLLANNYIENITYDYATEYLNTTYYDELEYKEYLLDNDCKDIMIDGNIKEETSVNKICMPNLYDFKMNEIKDGYLLTKTNNNYLVFDNKISYGSLDVTHNIYPIITISKNSKFRLENKSYILEK